MTTIVNEAPKSVKEENWYTILKNNQELYSLLMKHDDTASEVTNSEAAMRVIFHLDLQ